MADRETKNKLISIIILNYHTDDLVVDLIKKISHPSFEIILINNSQTDSLRSKLDCLGVDINYYFMNKNLGFSGGVNYGISQSRTEWIFLLNSDVQTKAGDILKFYNLARQENALVAVPKIRYLNGRSQQNVGLFPSPVHFIDYFFLRPKFFDVKQLGKNMLVDVATATAMLVKTKIFKEIGEMDDKNFFMYFEDIDFSYRLYKQGIPIHFIHNIEFVHLNGASSDQNLKDKNKNYQNSLNAFLEKHRGSFIMKLNNILGIFR